jgi:hypothetical protein
VNNAKTAATKLSLDIFVLINSKNDSPLYHAIESGLFLRAHYTTLWHFLEGRFTIELAAFAKHD